jgi:DNA repair exonuclease SbcCD nuclease subunit
MAKIALINDQHYGIKNDSPIFLDYFSKCHEWFFKILDDQNIKHAINLGDLFDRRKYLNFQTANRIRKDFFQPLVQRGIETHIITGNHDVYYKDTHEVNALREIVGNRYDNIKIYSVPCMLNIGGLDIQLIPWITPSNSEQSYQAIKTTKAEILMGHFEINGFEFFKGVVSDHGDDINTFSRFDMVISGHYHHKSTKGNINYLGAFGEYTWADYNDPRGFHIFDTETRELTFLQNPHKMFKMMLYDDVKHKDIVEKITSTNYTKYADCYVKIVCANRTNPYAFDLLLDKLYKANPADISVVEGSSSITDNNENETVDGAEDTQTILSTYIKGLTLPVDSDKMIMYMIEVYKEALSLESVE